MLSTSTPHDQACALLATRGVSPLTLVLLESVPRSSRGGPDSLRPYSMKRSLCAAGLRAAATHAAALLSAVLLATAMPACRREDSASRPAGERPTTGGSTVSTAAAATSELSNAGLELPADLAPGERRPLLLLLHGLGDTGRHFAHSSNWARFASERRIAWVSPDGARDRSGRRFWNAGPSCCNFDGLPVDHLGALRRLLERALATGAIDPQKVFAVGFSNGGFMAHRLGCQLDGLVKAVVSIAGAGTLPDEPCPARGVLRVLQIHGDVDTIVSYDGGRVFRSGAYREHLSAERTASEWAARLGCSPRPSPGGELDFEARLAGSETRVSRFGGCAAGSPGAAGDPAARVELWTVRGGAHLIGLGPPSQEAIWSFLEATDR
jgi:polyhydroxybutyrate depolymerase